MKKKIVNFLLLIFIALSFSTNVFATNEIKLKTDKEFLEEGEEITVTAKLSEDKKLYALTATLSYDENVFEAIDDSNFSLTDTDKEIIYNSKNNKFGIVNKSGEIPNDLLNVKLKVKKGADVGKTSISLTNVSASNGEEKVSYSGTSTYVTVTRDAKEGEVVPISKVENTNANVSDNTETSSAKKITNKTMIIVSSIALGLFAVALIAVNLLHIKNRKKVSIWLSVFIVLSGIVVISLNVSNNAKKDVNKDGKNNYEDAKSIMRYLIDMEGEKVEIAENLEQNVLTNSQQNGNNGSSGQSNNRGTNNNSGTVQQGGTNNNSGSAQQGGTNNGQSNVGSNGEQNNGQNPSNPSNSGTANSPSNGDNNDNENNNDSNSGNNNEENSNNPSENNNPDNDGENDNNPGGDNNQDNNEGDSNNPGNNNPNNNEEDSNKPNEDDDQPSKEPDYDFDGDGDVDIDDAGGSVQDTTDKKYDVDLIEVKDEEEKENKYYITKGEQIVLKFRTESLPDDERIEKVIIDGMSEPFDVVYDNSYYEVTLNAQDTAGEKNFKISKVILDNKREIETNLTIKREVLKSVPYVDMFNINEEHEMTFNVEDKDDAFIEGTITITDDQEENIVNKPINKENPNVIAYDFDENKNYLIEVHIKHDLDSNKSDDKNQYQKLMYTHSFSVKNNYDFKVENFSITDAIEKNEKPVISFDSTNSHDVKVKSITVNDKEYNITMQDGNHYEVALSKLDTDKCGKFDLKIDKVTLDDLKGFSNEKDFNASQLTYNVLKKAPIVENIKLEDNSEEKIINVKYDLKDEDTTAEKLRAVLLDSRDKIIKTEEIEDAKIKNGQLTFSYADNQDGAYKVRFLADCKLGTEKHTYIDKNIGEESILTDVGISIGNATVSTTFPTKNQKEFTIRYELKFSDAFLESNAENGNQYNELAAVTINGLNYDANRNSQLNYNANNKELKQTMISTVSFTVPNEAGIVDLEATRVQLRTEGYNHRRELYYSINPHTTEIEVLKDKPSISDFEVEEEDYEQGKVSFRFNVSDDNGGFERGEVTLNEETQEFEGTGLKTVTFSNAKKDELSDVKFYGDYCLDTDKINDYDEATKKEKNKYEHEEIYSIKYGLYNENTYNDLAIKNIKAVSNDSDSYFEKNEKIRIEFEIEGIKEDLGLVADKVVIGSKEYNISKTDNGYALELDGYTSFGQKELEITGLVFNTGKNVNLRNTSKVKLEVLKTPATIEDFVYEVDEQAKNIKMKFELKDLDRSISGNIADDVKIKILDEDKNVIQTFDYKDEIDFKPKDETSIYNVIVVANYDLDIEKSNELHNEKEKILLDEIVSLEKKNIELKDITDIILYKEDDNGNVEKVETVNVQEIKQNKNKYFVEIAMNQMQSVHGRIESVLEENNKLYLVLDYDFVTREGEKEKKDIRIEIGNIEDNQVNNVSTLETLPELLQRIHNNPSGEYILEKDYDINDYEIGDLAYLGTIDFRGTLNGDGYTIKNLNKSLFKSLTNATVENIKFENVKLPVKEDKGTVASTAINSNIKNILINDFNKTGSGGETGTLIGKVSDGTIIDGCKVTNFKLTNDWCNTPIGGFIGKVENSTVKNCYAVGMVDVSWNSTAGFIGQSFGRTILENNYSKVIFNNGINTANTQGFTNGNESLVLKNNVCLNTCSENVIGKFVDNFNKTESQNNYVLVEEGEELNIESVTGITKNEVNAELFGENRANFDNEVWRLRDISYDSSPTLNSELVSNVNIEEVEDEYNEDEETLYYNLSQMMPFYDSQQIVKYAKRIDKNNILYKQEISHIVPIDESGNVVTYLTTENPKKVKKLKIVFKDGTKAEYNLYYDRVYDMVANYRIPDLKISYTFNHYVINSNSQIVNNLTNYLSGLTYADNLDKLTPTVDDSRILIEFYNDVTKKELKEYVLKYLSNSNYTNIEEDETIDNYLETKIKKDELFEKLLYTYNYFRRFYDLDVDGIKVYDLILFNSQGFNKSLNPKDIANNFIKEATETLRLNKTNDTYKKIFSNSTELTNVTDYIEYIVKSFSDKDVKVWTKEQFKGYLKEVTVEGRDDVRYTLWEHLSGKDENYKHMSEGYLWLNYTLPILTLPKNAAYVLSTPTQFTIGSQRTYLTNPDDPVQQADLRSRIDSYAERMISYYTTAYGFLQDAKYFNNINTIQIDKRFTYDKNGIAVAQNKNTTQEPFHKNFNEVVDSWAYMDGNAATANGTAIIWRVEGIFDGRFDQGYEYTYHTWSHETAHNMDARLFLKNLGRRFDAGGEDYADGNLTQTRNDGDIVMNLSKKVTDQDVKISTNKDPERINSPEKIQDFYGKLFDTLYILDYLEGEAFLKLTPEEQSKIAVQASYPNEEKYKNDDKADYLQRQSTVYQQLDEDAFKNMELKTIDDLYDNKLVIYPGTIYSTIITNRYGGENIYKVRWYQPHNDKGRPDSYSIKWLAYEMLGYAGYNNGYIEYYSNRNSYKKDIYQNADKKEGSRTVDYKTDLDALKKITGNDNITFKEYKMSRFDKVKNNLTKIQYINVNEAFEKFYNALKEDAKYIKEQEKVAMERYPENVTERNKIISAAKKCEKSSNVRRELYYTIKDESNDFTGKVYDESKPQDVKKFTITEESKDEE